MEIVLRILSLDRMEYKREYEVYGGVKTLSSQIDRLCAMRLKFSAN